jgi:segregation and condensation protein A
MEEFVIKQGRFEGPYVKLLEMIEDRKMSISEISLSQIADDYIAYVKSLEQINNLDLSQFIVIAATLMLIKAKSLLPSIEYTKEEKEQVGDLENKLEIYRIIKEGEKNIKSKWQKTTLYNRSRTILKEKVFSPDKSFTKENLFSVAET